MLDCVSASAPCVKQSRNYNHKKAHVGCRWLCVSTSPLSHSRFVFAEFQHRWPRYAIVGICDVKSDIKSCIAPCFMPCSMPVMMLPKMIEL